MKYGEQVVMGTTCIPVGTVSALETTNYQTGSPAYVVADVLRNKFRNNYNRFTKRKRIYLTSEATLSFTKRNLLRKTKSRFTNQL
jgi:hypothetical protein